PQQPGLARWQAVSSSSAQGRVPVAAWWAVHEGHLAHLVGTDQDYLVFAYPLRGTFEFSSDAFPAALGYAGLLFQPAVGRIAPVGEHEAINRALDLATAPRSGR